VTQRFGLHAVKAAIRYFWLRASATARWVASLLSRPGVGGWTLLVTVATLVLMYRQIELANEQIRLANEQTRLAQEQTRLAQRQAAIIAKQEVLLARRAELAVRVGDKAVASDRVSVQIVMRNEGRKTADKYQFEVFVPESASPEFSSFKNSNLEPGVGTVAVDGVQYKRVFGFSYAPLYPKRQADMFRIDFAKPPKGGSSSVTLLWEVVAEDGVFGREGHEMRTITLAP